MSTSDFDAVYMLMFPGWKREPRGNRWIYANQWARRCPVVIVQQDPWQFGRRGKSVAEPRIANSRILRVAEIGAGRRGEAPRGLRQTEQILNDMSEHRIRRPLIWAYDPSYYAAYHLLPAACRIYHATENYFRFDNVKPTFLARLRKMANVSDLVVAVSDGVAGSIQPYVSSRVTVVTNGCDYDAYRNASADAEISKLAGSRRVIMYAGNINERLDFELLDAVAKANPNALLIFIGAVAGLTQPGRKSWRDLCRLPNVRHLGAVDPDRLPSMFHAADVGLIPYRTTPLLVEDSFPLKTFEMLATGLPVVTTYMKPISGYADGRLLAVNKSRQEFIDMVAKLSRGSLSAAERDALRELAGRQDYGIKFGQIRDLTAMAGHEAMPADDNPFFDQDQAELLLTFDGRGLAWWRHFVEFARAACPDSVKQALKDVYSLVRSRRGAAR